MKIDPLNIFLKNEIKHNIRWSDRRKRGGGFYKKIKKIRAVLESISGKDTVNMLKDVLTKDEKLKFCQTELNCLKNLKEFYLKSKPSKKRELISKLKKAKLSIRKARMYGFKVSSDMWSKSLKKNKFPPNKLSLDLINDLNDHLENQSEIASNRTIKIDNELVYVRYMKISISEAYRIFKRKDQLSLSAFFSYVSNKFKKSQRLSDLCEYCELGKQLKKELALLAFNLNFVSNNEYKINLKSESLDFSYTLLNNFLNGLPHSEQQEKGLENIKKLELIKFHYQIAKRQRKSYKNMLNNKKLFDDSIIIEMDYKQKILIGMSPRQVSGEFYRQQQRSLLGKFLFI